MARRNGFVLSCDIQKSGVFKINPRLPNVKPLQHKGKIKVLCKCGDKEEWSSVVLKGFRTLDGKTSRSSSKTVEFSMTDEKTKPIEENGKRTWVQSVKNLPDFGERVLVSFVAVFERTGGGKIEIDPIYREDPT